MSPRVWATADVAVRLPGAQEKSHSARTGVALDPAARLAELTI